MMNNAPFTLIMHIDADAFFASVEQGFNPLLRNRPVVVGGKENQRGVVHTASYEARAFGISTGMPLYRAKALCPQCVFLKGDYEHYRAVSQTMQEIYLNYTPQVEFTSLDDAYLDLSGALHLYPSPQWVGRQIQQEVLRRTGVGVSVGTGSSKMIARIASGLDKPRGLRCIEPGRERDFLQSLAVDMLPGVGRRSKEKLTDLGIFTVGQLAALPRLILEQLFGRNGQKLWDLANGIDSRVVEAQHIPRHISRETSLEEDTGDVKLVLATLQYLTERIAAKLREMQLQAGSISVKIGYSDFTRHNKGRRLPYPCSESQELFRAASALFDELHLRRVRIRHIGLQVEDIEPAGYQGTLFDEVQKEEALNTAVDELRGRFGFMSIMPADTLELKNRYRMDRHGYILHNPALTR